MSAPVKGRDVEPFATVAAVWTGSVDGGETTLLLTVGGVQPV